MKMEIFGNLLHLWLLNLSLQRLLKENEFTLAPFS
jgi:hypothetical protein